MDFVEFSDDDEDDDFFMQSIQRYNTLQMFNVENVPYHILPISETTICVVSKRKNGNSSEILKLRIPAKLFLHPDEDGRSKENDFKVVSGAFTDSLIYKIGKLMKDDKIITSEIGTPGLQIYTITDSLLGINNESHKLGLIKWNGAEFNVIEDSSQLICSKCLHEPLIQVDISSGTVIKEIRHPFHPTHQSSSTSYISNISNVNVNMQMDTCAVNNIQCKALSSDTVAVLNMLSGGVILHDLRSNEFANSLPGISRVHNGEMWTFSGCDFKESSLNYLGILSNKKSFYIYDKRTNAMLIQHSGDGPAVEDPGKLRLKFSDDHRKFSISGTNACVDVYEMNSNNFQQIFSHNGHCPKNVTSCYVTDHIWQKTEAREFIISICDNKTLNCWDCKV